MTIWGIVTESASDYSAKDDHTIIIDGMGISAVVTQYNTEGLIILYYRSLCHAPGLTLNYYQLILFQ